MQRPLVVLLVCALVLGLEPARAEPKFFPDDPLLRDPDDVAIPKPGEIELSTAYDVIENTFQHRPKGAIPRAMNVNTLDEVPDSSWFTNRIGRRPMTIEELTRGPNRTDGPDLSGPVVIIRGKSGGITPGFTIHDGRGDVYFIKFDPPAYPNLSTAPDVLVPKFFYAFGYEVPENYVGYLRREQLRIDPRAAVSVRGGKKRPMTEADLDAILAGVYKRPDGAVRVVASQALEGEPLGPFKYFGTRGDDPNDIYPHQHRRELRGMRVFAAWFNHDDSRSINSLDTYMSDGERQWVRHHLIDFASCLGSGSNARRQIAPQNPRGGNEYILEAGPIVKSALTLGIWERPWRKVRYPSYPEIGNLEAEFFRPERWQGEYPNPAFERMRNDDAFWAARIVSRLSDEAVRAIVHTGGYDDPAAERYLADTLIERRDKIVAHYFRQVNPLSEFRVGSAPDAEVLEFENLGEAAGVLRADAYEHQWFAFDNASGRTEALGPPATTAERSLPVAYGSSPYAMVRIRTHAAEPNWRKAVDVYLRLSGGPQVVGIEREN